MICNQIPEEKRNYLGCECTKEELEDLKLIINKSTCATQALDPCNIPENCTDRQAELFTKAALNAKAEAQYLEDYWWQSMKEKYNFSDGTFIDFNSRKFYLAKE